MNWSPETLRTALGVGHIVWMRMYYGVCEYDGSLMDYYMYSMARLTLGWATEMMSLFEDAARWWIT